MENKVASLYAASLAGLGLLLLAGPFALGASPTAGGWDDLSHTLFAALGLALLAGQAVLVYRGILGAVSTQRLEAEQLRRRLSELSGRDELTGAHNRTMLEQVLTREMEAVRRYGAQTSCIMLDVDGLGRINRERGFRGGDRLLRELAGALRNNLRATDTLFRWQGGRFMVLIPHVRVDMAAHLGEKLRRLVERHEFSDGQQATICISVGQVWPEDTPETLVARLRIGLTRAKHDGPSRMEVLRGN